VVHHHGDDFFETLSHIW
jgi:hypothetical protein